MFELLTPLRSAVASASLIVEACVECVVIYRGQYSLLNFQPVENELLYIQLFSRSRQLIVTSILSSSYAVAALGQLWYCDPDLFSNSSPLSQDDDTILAEEIYEDTPVLKVKNMYSFQVCNPYTIVLVCTYFIVGSEYALLLETALQFLSVWSAYGTCQHTHVWCP